jgi:hypothetical protein
MGDGPRPSKQEELAAAIRTFLVVVPATLGFLATLVGLLELGILAAFLILVAVITGVAAGWSKIGPERRGEVLRALHSLSRRWAIAGVLVGLLLMAVAAALLSRSPDDPSQPQILRQVSRLGAGPASIAVGGDHVWIWFRKEGKIVRLNRRTGQVMDDPAAYLGDEEPTLVVPGRSGGIIESGLPAGGITAVGERAWVASERDIYLLSPESNYSPLATDTTGGVEALVAHGNKLWVLLPSGDVSELELFVNGFGLTKMPGNNEILDITYGDGSVWAVAKPRDVLRLPYQGLPLDEVQAIPPASRDALIPPGAGTGDRIRVHQRNTAIVFGADMLWLFRPGGRTLRRLDPHTGRLQASLHLGFAFDDVAVNDDGLWLVRSPTGAKPSSLIARFDPDTLRASGLTRVSGVVHSMAVDAEHLWAIVLKGPPSPWQPALLLEIGPG